MAGMNLALYLGTGILVLMLIGAILVIWIDAWDSVGEHGWRRTALALGKVLQWAVILAISVGLLIGIGWLASKVLP